MIVTSLLGTDCFSRHTELPLWCVRRDEAAQSRPELTQHGQDWKCVWKTEIKPVRATSQAPFPPLTHLHLQFEAASRRWFHTQPVYATSTFNKNKKLHVYVLNPHIFADICGVDTNVGSVPYLKLKVLSGNPGETPGGRRKRKQTESRRRASFSCFNAANRAYLQSSTVRNQNSLFH